MCRNPCAPSLFQSERTQKCQCKLLGRKTKSSRVHIQRHCHDHRAPSQDFYHTVMIYDPCTTAVSFLFQLPPTDRTLPIWPAPTLNSLSQAHCSKHGQGIKSGNLSHSGSTHQLSICTKVMHKRGEEGSGICFDISYHAGAFSGASHVSVNSHHKQKPVGFWLAPKHWHYGTYLTKIVIMCFNSDNWTLISLQPTIQCHLGMRAEEHKDQR